MDISESKGDGFQAWMFDKVERVELEWRLD